MAKRGTLEHPKTLKLARKLGIEPWAALGLLEGLWHWCSRYAITGEIKSDPEEIADGLRYGGDATTMFEALVECGWIERVDGRCFVHDVEDHADNTWKANLKRAGLEFATPPLPNPEPVTTQSQLNHNSVTTESQLSSDPPKPEPEPLPENTPSDKSSGVGGVAPTGAVSGGVSEGSEPPPKPDPKPKRSLTIESQVREAVEYLNLVAGKKFDPDGSQGKFARARLKAGASVEQLCLVVDHRVSLWLRDDKMRAYLRPETLWCQQHWEDYLPEAVDWDGKGRPEPVAKNGKPQTDGIGRYETRYAAGGGC